MTKEKADRGAKINRGRARRYLKDFRILPTKEYAIDQLAHATEATVFWEAVIKVLDEREPLLNGPTKEWKDSK